MKKEMFKELSKEVTKDGIVEEVKKAISILALKEADVKAVSEAKKSEIYGALIFLLPIVVNFVFALFSSYRLSFVFLLSKLFIPILAFFGALFLIVFVAEKAFKTKLDMKALFRVMSYSSIATWLTVLPSLSAFVSYNSFFGFLSSTRFLVLWIFVVVFIYLSKVLKMKQNDVIVLAVSGAVAYFLAIELLIGIFIGNTYGFGFYF